ncbi:MAG TPA: PDZ domain-containing protein, partial [Caldimonas sp.]|nr:PDZ domain-containing protein [Caldimonas sp.]
ALVGKGRVARPWLGIGAQTVPVQDAGATEQSGLLVTALVAGGPAERAGLKIGDIIVRAAESAAANLRELRQVLAAHVGGIVTLGILRGGAPLDLSAEVGEWPEHRCR